MLRRLGVVAIGLVVALAPANAAARPDARAAAPPSLRQLAKGIVAVGSPGAVVHVHDARGTRTGTAGFANLRTRERLGADHTFRVGSITKSFVAVVVVQLASEGVLRLDDSVEHWLPGVVPNGQGITLRQLLNHTSGVFNYTEDPAILRAMIENPLTVWPPAALVGLANSHRPLFAPGSSWSYSNTGYILLGLVVERATGQPIGEELRRRIFEPLRLTRTSFPTAPTLTPPFAHGYLPRGNGVVPTPGGRPADVTAWHPSWAWAAGALVSTAGDLARFYGALLGGDLVGPEALRELKTVVPAYEYGLGLSRLQLICSAAWGHGGSVPGYTSLAFTSEDGSHQAVVLVNTSPTPAIGSRFERALGSAFCR